MPSLRALTPWLLALLALAWALAPHVSKDSLVLAAPYLAAAVLFILLALAATKLWRRRRSTPIDPQTALAHQRRRALAGTVAAARRHRPARIWLCLGLPRHGKTTLLASLGPLRTLGQPTSHPAVQLHLHETTSDLLLEHPGLPCELAPLTTLRPRQPLDAILLVVSLPDLLTTPPSTLAAALRPQLLAVLDTLAVDVPIYLIVSKLDTLAGHAELSADLREPWGFELGTPADLPTQLAAWSQWVLTQRLARLASETDPARRARLFTFGAAFTRACERLEQLTHELLAPHRSTTPQLRGLHFTATTSTAPSDPILDELATTLHTRLRTLLAPPRTTTPTDLRPLFTALRQRSREATRTPTARRTAQLRSHILAAALALLAIGLTLTASDTTDEIHTRLQTLADLGTTLTTDDTTQPLLSLRAELDRWPTTPETSLHGLFTPALRPALLALYRQTAHERLLRPIWRDLSETLTTGTHDQLRAYLLLTAPNDLSSEPGPLDPTQRRWLLTELPRLADNHTPGELGLLLTTLLAHATPDDLRFPRDHALVEQARTRLRALDDDEAVVRAALVAGDTACEPLSLRALTHAQQLSGATTLPCGFTRTGWRRVHTQLLRAAEHRDGWILGRPTREHADPARLARLRARYDALYIAAWTDFLAGLRVRRPGDLADTSRLLAELTGDERPLAQIFAALDHHTRGLQRSATDEPSLTGLLQGLDHPEHSAAIVRAFAPLLTFAIATPDRQAGLDRYHARLAELRDALEAARRDPAELAALHTVLTTALADTHALLQHADLRRFRPLLSTLLLPPLTALQGELRDHGKLALTRAYCSEIDLPLRRLVARYPFNRDAHEELSLDEFTGFFHPETGTLRRFRDTQLSTLITIHGPEMTARPGPRDEDHPISPAVLALFARGAELGALAFPGGELGLDLELDFQCNADIGRVRLTLDGATHSYTCGPDHRARMRWPGKAEPRGATLELVGRDGRRETVPGPGPWGLWHLLEKPDLVTLPDDRDQPRLVFHLDLRASRLGTLDLAVTPPRSHGATLFFGATPTSDTPLLAPLRTRELLDPPPTLFLGLPACADLPAEAP